MVVWPVIDITKSFQMLSEKMETVTSKKQSPQAIKKSKKKFKVSLNVENTSNKVIIPSNDGNQAKKAKKWKKKKKDPSNGKAKVQSEIKETTEPLEVVSKKDKKKMLKRAKGEESEVADHAEPDRKRSKVDENGEESVVQMKGKKCKKKKSDDHIHQSAGQNKALRYLQMWNQSQNGESVTWKFEKCRQIWLLQNAYDTQRIPDDDFDILLKYMCSIRGQMRQGAKDSAQEKLTKAQEVSNLRKQLEEDGKTQAEVLLELDTSGLPSEKVLQRASDIVEMLA